MGREVSVCQSAFVVEGARALRHVGGFESQCLGVPRGEDRKDQGREEEKFGCD